MSSNRAGKFCKKKKNKFLFFFFLNSWVGGITECRRIVHMASAFDLKVIPHGSSVFSYHLQYANQNCPEAEFLIMSPKVSFFFFFLQRNFLIFFYFWLLKADKIVPLFGNLFVDEPLPKDGWIDLPNKPGFGVELNRSELKLERPYSKRK